MSFYRIHKDTVALILWSVFMLFLYLSPGANYWSERIDAQSALECGDRVTALKHTEERGSDIHATTSNHDETCEIFMVDKKSDADGSEASSSETNEIPKKNVLKESTLKVADSVLNDHVEAKERLAHGLPMAGFAFCLVRIFRHRGRRRLFAVVVTVLATGAFSLVIESSQELLPESFAHGFAVSDIAMSLLGGLTGALAGLFSTAEPAMHVAK